MKNLIYKELRLCLHPILLVFVILFPILESTSPGSPIAISFLFSVAGYSILFIGANKGVQTNDLLYTALLPVRKKDIVLGRMFTTTLLHVISIVMAIICGFMNKVMTSQIIASMSPEEAADLLESIGGTVGIEGVMGIIGIALVGYSIHDLIFYNIYYKNGRSIIKSTLLAMLAFFVVIIGIGILVPGINPVICNELQTNVLLQVGLLIGGLVIYVLLHYLTYVTSAKKLEKVDL